MATAKDIDAPLTLELSGDEVTPEVFVRGARSFFALLQELTDQIDDTVSWRVQVKQGSNLLGVYPRGFSSTGAAGRIISNVEAGLAMLEREAAEPPCFTEKALNSARDLGKLSLAGDGDLIVRVWAAKSPTDLSARSVANIDELLTGAFDEYGALEGKVQTISERGGAKFVVYESLRDTPVRCVVPSDRLELALNAFGKRSEVYGLISYRRDGTASRIRVDDIIPFPPDADLPSASDVRGLMRNFPR